VHSEGDPIQRLIEALARLPGIGRKTATRLAFFLLNADPAYAQELAAAVVEVKARIGYCEVCANLCEAARCRICASTKRDPQVICVVESPQDLLAVEATGDFDGLYHVLHGVISPLDGVGPDDLKIAALLQRVRETDLQEVILATNPSVEGEATAIYLQRLLAPLGLKVSRIASGLPMGAQLEYADKATLGRSLKERRTLL